MKNLIIALVVIVIVIVGYFGFKSLYKVPSTTITTAVATNQVSINNFSFIPNNISVGVGQEVIFTNNDSATHSIVANDNSFTSGDLTPGQVFKKTFSTVGTVSYHCSIHPSMTGQIEVQ